MAEEHKEEVRCANCRLRVDINRYIVRPDDTLPALHRVTVKEGFIGTIRCPGCHHYTTYQFE